MLKQSLDLTEKDLPKSLFVNKSVKNLAENKRELAYEEKKKRRELYNKELFGVENNKDKEYNPFYDNSYLHNISNLSSSQIVGNNSNENNEKTLKTEKNYRFFNENSIMNRERTGNYDNKERSVEKKDQFIQTDDRFFPENNKNFKSLDLKNKKEKKDKIIYKPFFEEQTDHKIFEKIKQDYQSYVRSEGKNPKKKSEKTVKYKENQHFLNNDDNFNEQASYLANNNNNNFNNEVDNNYNEETYENHNSANNNYNNSNKNNNNQVIANSFEKNQSFINNNNSNIYNNELKINKKKHMNDDKDNKNTRNAHSLDQKQKEFLQRLEDKKTYANELNDMVNIYILKFL